MIYGDITDAIQTIQYTGCKTYNAIKPMQYKRCEINNTIQLSKKEFRLWTEEKEEGSGRYGK